VSFWKFLRFNQRLENIFLGPRSQYVIAFRSKAPEDFDYLFRGLAGTVNNFRKAPPDLPVMVHAGKPQILERQMAKFFNCLVDTNFVVFDLFK